MNSNRLSTASSWTLDPADSNYTALAAFLVLKIIFWDIGTSLGDTLTDFLQALLPSLSSSSLQGFQLIYDSNGELRGEENGDTMVSSRRK